MNVERYAWFIVRNRKLVLILAAIGFLISIAGFSKLNERTEFGVFVDESSEAHLAQQELEREHEFSAPNLTIAIQARWGSVDSRRVAREARAYVNHLAAEPGIADVVSYWNAGSDRATELRGNTGRTGLVYARILGDEDVVDAKLRAIRDQLSEDGEAITTHLGGQAALLAEGTDVSKHDLVQAELITAPLILIALLVIFGSITAAAIPLAMAAGVVLVTGAVLWVLSFAMTVSTFSLFFTTVLGLGLAIDYSLFIVTRFREEMASGVSAEQAVVRTMLTAGKTVLFSGIAVGIALAGLLLVPLFSVQSSGIAGMLTALLAGVGGLMVLPAVLATVGPRINAGTVLHRSTSAGDGKGFWYRIARRVMRRPFAISGLIIVGLLVAGIPLLSFNPSFIDDRGFVTGTENRDAGDILRSEFEGQTATPMIVLVNDGRTSNWDTRLDRFAARISGEGSVASVSASTGRYIDGHRRPIGNAQARALGNPGSSYMLVVHDAEPLDDESIDLVDRVRSMPAPFARVRVTGEAANVRDVVGAIVGGLPLLIAFVGGASFLILMIQFGSIVAPLIAVFVSALSLSALCGAMIWAFQMGHYGELVDLITTDTIHVFAILFTVCFAFGLSMDYQVFLLSRIQEEHERGRPTRDAIALGLGRSGRVVTAAAILIAIVFLSAGTLGSEQFSKAFGLGMGLVVLLDAFVIRGTLVPALMWMAGEACWWGPAWLQRLRDATGLSEVVIEQPQEGTERVQQSS